VKLLGGDYFMLIGYSNCKDLVSFSINVALKIKKEGKGNESLCFIYCSVLKHFIGSCIELIKRKRGKCDLVHDFSKDIRMTYFYFVYKP
jgi:hypothetical protein